MVVFRQMGTLHALLPLISHMRSQLSEPLLLGWDQLIPKETADSFGLLLFNDVNRFLELAPARTSFLLTGTSEKSEEDSKLWQWAFENNIPSFAFVDQWSNIAIRFKNAVRAPDHILVLDGWCAEEVKKLNLSSKVHITGTPLWDDLSTVIRKTKSDKCEAVFVTEPVSVMPLEEHIALHGYQDLDSLKWAIVALEQWQAHTGKKCILKIKLHPRDTEQRIKDWLENQKPQVEIQISNEDKQTTLRTADYVFGDRSMLLVEASLIGIPVVSFQPNRKSVSPATDRDGIEVVTKQTDILTAMKRALHNTSHLPAVKASEKIMEVINGELS